MQNKKLKLIYKISLLSFFTSLSLQTRNVFANDCNIAKIGNEISEPSKLCKNSKLPYNCQEKINIRKY